eukprot:387956_1
MGDPSKLYHSLSYLGAGGFGSVYKAKDKSNNYVAIKKIPFKEYKSIQQEVGLLKQCHCKYIVKLLNEHNDYSSQCCWVVLEYCAGGSIEHLAGKCTENKLKKIASDTLNGLKYLHAKKLVHRDIKPHNMLHHTTSDTYKIADFGLSKDTMFSKAKTTVGTLYFMAPEILKNSAGKYDEKVDIWAFGVSLYFLATGHFPHEGSGQFQLVNSIVNQYPKKLNKFSVHAQDVVNNKCLVKYSAARHSAQRLLQHSWFNDDDEKGVVYHMSDKSDKIKSNNEPMIGIVLHKYDNNSRWRMSGIQCRHGYVILKLAKNIQHISTTTTCTMHSKCYKSVFGLEPDNKLVARGFAFHNGTWKYRCRSLNGWDNNGTMDKLEQIRIQKVIASWKKGIQNTVV